jgi:nonsense-mediated mRNA decay protein 3
MVFGYDLTCSHWTSEEDTIKVLGRTDLPDVVLVRKCYKTKGERRWLLKSIQFDETAPQTSKEQAAAEGDYEAFLEQLEGDKEMRAHVNLYKGS